jgi:hypothetical protein
VLLALATSAPAEEPAPLSLFDGKTLDGWKRVETFKGGPVSVEGGTLVLGQGGPMTAVVCSRAGLPTLDYELSFEAKRTSGGDFFAAATFPVGPSFITLVNGGWGGSVTGLSSLNGADASENETRQFIKYQNDTWYRFRVHVTADVLRVWVDDKPTCAVNYQGQQVKTRVEVRPCQPLGFASYRSTGAIREVKVRKLTPAEVAEANKSVEP